MSSKPVAGVSRIVFNGVPAWRKRYGNVTRRWWLRWLDRVVCWLGIPALRPPPRKQATGACQIEYRRLIQLQDQGVRVPQVLAVKGNSLVLSDIGETLAHRLRVSSPAEAATWFVRTVEEMARLHQAGVYLGQPQARNITVDAQGRIGFLDFEEDPLEVMDLANAQVRDWLLFMVGTVRHVPQDENELSALLKAPFARLPPAVRERLAKATAALEFLGGLSRLKGRRAAALGKAVNALRHALGSWVVMLTLLFLGMDYLHDGELEILEFLAPLFQ